MKKKRHLKKAKDNLEKEDTLEVLTNTLYKQKQKRYTPAR